MSTYRQKLAAAGCFAFGVILIANTQATNDGGWYWYAWLLLQGKRLYSDMHLPLQPVFVLETALFLTLFGKSWAASKIAAVIHLLAYCLGVYLLARLSAWKDHQKALVILCAFFLTIRFEGYRFDDYHIVKDCFVVYSLVLLALILEPGNRNRISLLAAGLGILGGLTVVTRINDGAALIGTIAVVILCGGRERKLVAALTIILAAVITIVSVVHLTGDSLHDYAINTIFKAAGAKGGSANVLTYPFLLPVSAVRDLFTRGWMSRVLLYAAVVSLGWALLIRPLTKAALRASPFKIAIGILVIGIALQREIPSIVSGQFLLALLALGVLVAYPLGIAIGVRYLRRSFVGNTPAGWTPHELLLLVPLAMMVSGSMSSGGHYNDMYAQLGLMILLISLASPFPIDLGWRRSTFLAVTVMMAISGMFYKSAQPYSWLSYKSRRLFLDRQVYSHPGYGSMIIDRQLLEFIAPLCERIKEGPAHPDLLSLPLTYANYFCEIPPWHGYVQTFFDTSTKSTISGLMDELQTAPPLWIFYQRQLEYLQHHERIFNGGKPLPHRALDELIQQKIAQGGWSVAARSNYGGDSDWLLLRTRQ